MTPLRIAIVGSGTAGPAAALLLARQGHEVTLYERAQEEKAVGAGFLLQPTGLAVLDQLGLAEEVIAVTSRIDALYCETKKGTPILDLSYGELGEGMFGLGTHRSSLLRILLRETEKAGVTLEWDHEITGTGWTSDRRRILKCSDGEEVGPFDLVLVCDGARSALRDQMEIPAKVSRYPWGALWWIGKRTSDFKPDTLWQAVGTTRELTGFLPTGTSEDLLSIFWSVRLDEIENWKGKPVQEWRDLACRLVPRAENFLNQVDSMEQLQSSAYHDVRMKQWHGERVAFLGDAAHALSPQLGQGVNLALVDASVLADCLSKESLEKALASYSRERKQHVGFYQFATRWCTPFFQSDYPILGQLRDLSFPLAMKLPWARRQMTTTMAGLKTGTFSSLRSVGGD